YKQGKGLLGRCSVYYAMVEAQGCGTLHCHLLVWVEGNPDPNQLRSRIHDDGTFKSSIISWLEDTIKCKFPGMMNIEDPPFDEHDIDPHLENVPQVIALDDETFATEFWKFVKWLAIKCNWPQHTATCYKHLKPGEVGGNDNCCMHINGTVWSFTGINPDTKSILLRQLHPWINNFNDVIIYLLQCNMDIKYIGSGSTAKVLTYFINDYIAKDELKVHVGLQALQSAIESHCECFCNESIFSDEFHNKNLLTKTVNAMTGRQEISHQQVMSYLIGGGDHYAAHEF
ncbi:hypothetical protein F5J12DRAFT_722853, partial [Pisolithus orientalis]|uniref:uncharacterized protein n=1 Tax=Pisolithus orientalis TaxID=936130 RepID=UPI00222409F0